MCIRDRPPTIPVHKYSLTVCTFACSTGLLQKFWNHPRHDPPIVMYIASHDPPIVKYITSPKPADSISQRNLAAYERVAVLNHVLW
eukprot:248386-Amphidinium_carterae.1